jgi:hypothetical protein
MQGFKKHAVQLQIQAQPDVPVSCSKSWFSVIFILVCRRQL